MHELLETVVANNDKQSRLRFGSKKKTRHFVPRFAFWYLG